MYGAVRLVVHVAAPRALASLAVLYGAAKQSNESAPAPSDADKVRAL